MSEKKRVLKRSESGIELEFHLLDSEGNIASVADKVINAVKKNYPEVDIAPECFQNMIELRSYPSVKLRDNLPSLLEDLRKVVGVAYSMGYKVLPLATYPGKFQAHQTQKGRYDIALKVFGRKAFFDVSSKCTGLHYHYTLPRGVFDRETGFVKRLIKSKTKQSMIDAFNMLVAVDPAVTTFMQSSPFLEGQFVGKDSRVLIYRGGEEFGYDGNLFKEFRLLRGLPPYIHTGEDLITRLNKMDEFFKKKMKAKGFSKELKSKKKLDFVWNPVKINKIGTIEQRGMDINHPKYFVAVAAMLKYVLRLIQQDFFHVMPSDIGIKEPFKVEGNTVYVPPISHVRNILQVEGAWKGFESREVFDYCNKFFKFAQKYVHKDYRKSLRPITAMLGRKKTVSDILIMKALRRGYSLEEELPESYCKAIALRSSRQLLRELDKTIKALPGV